MEMGFLRGLITVLTLVAFLGICWWAYRPANKRRFEEDAMLPFDDADADERADDEGEENHGGAAR